mmetsp:Transcript_14245/g.18651  ORF Transcript_14245/g.18651 Transcript_14245/m.18651 type:complete len:122 (-) Transcript_14245:188-553(-)
MGCRIVCSVIFTGRYFGARQKTDDPSKRVYHDWTFLREAQPHWVVMMVFIASFVVTLHSKSFFLDFSTSKHDEIFVNLMHIAVGIVCFLALVFSALIFEGRLIWQLKSLRKGDLSEKQKQS